VSIFDSKKLFIGLTTLLVVPVFALAQDEEEPQAEVDETIENIIVTGSRIKRNTYSSIAPLQVITAQASREVGLIDAASILQDSGAASGGQIDLSFSTFVTPDGPGAKTISLRGLGPARTLVMLNGRRLAPAGVEGAPVSADIGMIPGSLVQQYDLLLDGASSIYGSDAVAGVTNIILRKDFDGFEFEAYTNVPEQSSGVSSVMSALWGKNYDRGFIGIGVEYEDSESVALQDRRWMRPFIRLPTASVTTWNGTIAPSIRSCPGASLPRSSAAFIRRPARPTPDCLAGPNRAFRVT
jgi:iron complex outermembrane receptor protein